MSLFWNCAQCILVGSKQCLKRATVFTIRAMVMEEVSSTEMSVNIVLHGVTSHKTATSLVLCENLKSQKIHFPFKMYPFTVTLKIVHV